MTTEASSRLELVVRGRWIEWLFLLAVLPILFLAWTVDANASDDDQVPTVYFGFSTTTLERSDAPSGALHVDRVTPEKPADRAGLRAGDLIVAFNHQPFRFATDAEAFRGLAWVKPNEPLRLTVERRGETIELVMTPEAATPEQVARNRRWLKEADSQGGRACLQDVDDATACFFELDRLVAAAGDRAVIRIERLPGEPPRFSASSEQIEIPPEFDWRKLWPHFSWKIDRLIPGESYSLEIVRTGDRTRVAPLDQKAAKSASE